MITEDGMYWILVLDNIHMGLQPIIAISLVATIIGGIIWFMTTGASIGGLDAREICIIKAAKRLFIISLTVCLLSTFTIMFLPNTKQMVAIKVVPALTSSEVVQKDIPELYQMAVDCLKKQLIKAGQSE